MTDNICEIKTEKIFRNFYKKDNFLEKAEIPPEYGFKSKKRTGYKGEPDFFKKDENFYFICEAKTNNFKLAKEEIRWYMTNNAIESGIIVGIAVSGQTKSSLEVEYSYCRADDKKIEKLDYTKLIPIKKIEEDVDKLIYGEYLSVEELNSFLGSLNEKFQANNIRDTDRSLFFSGLMIALTNSNLKTNIL